MRLPTTVTPEPRPETLIGQLASRAASRPAATALADRVAPGRWQELSWCAVRERAWGVARGLIALGVASGERVSIVSANRSEWILAQLGIFAARAVSAPVYTTLTAEQTAEVLRLASARVVFCDAAALPKLREIRARDLAPIRWVVAFDGAPSEPGTLSFGELLGLGGESSSELEARLAALAADDPALVVFTSGTTGRPKGVVLDAVATNALVEAIRALGYAPILTPEAYRIVSYLPLSHIAEQATSFIFWLAAGGSLWCCRDLAEVVTHLEEVRPRAFLGVPRAYEKIRARIEERLRAAPPLRRRLFRWATAVELAAFEREAAGGRPVRSPLRNLARRLVIDRVRHALGLDQVRFAVVGAAPAALSTLQFFAGLGLPLHEVYGMSETCGVLTAPPFGRPRLGRVGRALPGVELRLSGEGEILARTRHATRGYLDDPAATAELIDAAGWLHTGDLGELDADGYLRISGRKKELLVTAGGKKVAPAEVEERLQSIEGIAHAVVVGDSRPYLSALLTLEREAAERVAARLGLAAHHSEALLTEPGFRRHLEEQIEAACNRFLARYQTIKRFVVLRGEFTVAGGELTPTMKLRRSVIAVKYASEIDALYSD